VKMTGLITNGLMLLKWNSSYHSHSATALKKLSSAYPHPLFRRERYCVSQCYRACPKEQPIQCDRKVTQSILDTCCICQKIKYTEIRKQCYTSCWKCLPRSAVHASRLSSRLMQHGVHTLETVHVSHKKTAKWIPKLTLAS
jgi:hypothetical protein